MSKFVGEYASGISRRQTLQGICIGPLWYICGIRATVQAVILAAEVLDAAINIFEKSSIAYQSSVDGPVGDLRVKLRNHRADLSAIAKDWEVKRLDMVGNASDLKGKFADLTSKAVAYWAALNEITSEITDSEKRKIEQQKNGELRAQWDSAYTNARTKIAAIDSIQGKSEDIGRLLAISAMRADLNQYVVELNAMSKEADNLLASLQGFSKVARANVKVRKAA